MLKNIVRKHIKLFNLCRIVLTCLALVLVGSLLYICLHITTNDVTATYYNIEAKILFNLRIVQLSDLHNSEFGNGSVELVELVEEQKPDIILMTGDMINRDDSNTDIITNLITNLIKIAPVYYSYGNHEYTWIENYNIDLKSVLEKAGAIVVDNDFYDVEINGDNLRIGGYMGYYTKPGMMTKDPERQAIEYAFADDFENTDNYKILLNHIPTGWIDWGYMNTRSVDLVFSGHYHGGQWVLPIIGAVYAPYIGFNPPYTKGVFIGEKATCVLSAGLGNEYAYLPRVNNPPEIVVVDLIPQN